MTAKNSNSPFPHGSLLAAYLRDSGGEEQDLSIEQQEAALRTWCAEHGLVLSRVFRDTRSGTSTVGRAGFEELIRYFAHSKHVPEAGILLWRYNRFARDLDDAQFFKAGLRRRGYAIHALNDPIPEGPAGRILEFFIDWMADKFSEDLSVDVRRGQLQLLERYGALGGTPPRGFIRVPVEMPARRDGSLHQVHRWAPDPVLWETCLRAWHMRAAGASYRQIHAETHLFGAVTSYSAFFRNRIYLGELAFSDQVVIPDYVPALIDRDTWDAVQALNSANAANTAPNHARHPRRIAGDYLLSGLLHCARCGRLMIGHTIHIQPDPVRRYYRCGLRHASRGCDAPLIPADQLEAALLEDLAATILSPLSIASARADRQSRQAVQEALDTARRAEINARLAQIRRRLANVTDSIADSGRSPALLARLRELETEQADLQVQLDALANRPVILDLSPAQIERYSRSLQTLLTYADQPTRKTLLTGLLQRVESVRDGRQVTTTYYYYDPTDDLIAQIARIPESDLLTGPDPPGGYVRRSPGSTTHRHHFTAETKRRS